MRERAAAPSGVCWIGWSGCWRFRCGGWRSREKRRKILQKISLQSVKIGLQ